MRRKEDLFFVLILIGLLLISNTHLGNSFGDSIFRAVGIPPWTNTEYDSGLHISVIVGLLVIVAGYIGAVKFYQFRFPKIRSRIVLSCIAFAFLFPIVTENALILLKYNSVSVSSVAFSKKNSQCSYRSEEANVKADCTVTLINYGKEKAVTVRPYLIRSTAKVKFEPMTITLPPHQKVGVGTAFNGKLLDGTGFSGWSNDIGIEIEVDGLKKRYGKE
ncbi:hypothetical protein ACFQI7_37320 [Paenibacillus allorhizosphaerae]|uniref:Uncharacterized protein n=1 Tax=Paenibacillus allorhizosphaerae TaxID=2849866 RepID=A0ABM8VUU2_9BACL|nr:hypothetical protein [Paenibacillus allorhizosphaerae]CAG7659096.1 hypothetical protein PAECIP111802_07365 [Paenibacillus allorhizosphaerae]